MNHSHTTTYPLLKWINVGLRGLMEATLVLGLGYLGYLLGNRTLWRILLTILLPLSVFGFWSIVDFHRLHRHAELFRLIEEIVITGMIAIALFFNGAHWVAWILAILSLLHHSLTYLLGERLLKHTRSSKN